ncbi:hypothetical protein LOTGIDRAFT_152548 [Lottia gigantea]|uniref:Stathmin n=1 Tax=Lottia gigantea TaxID=225164 RepID=V4BD02_LOTGI|nr:hypothetical protein LOTGIDRAFT_152548 [Lottia gigantea]ESP05681.1 hypothetical protein LOTGIDRAFT_152548 [Lottia gigantea]
MGCILSTRSERKPRRRRGNAIKVQPIGNGSDLVMCKTDFTIFQVKTLEERTTNSEANVMPKSSAVEEKCGNDEGLVLKLTGVAAKGVAFELSQEGKAIVAPPPRLLEIVEKKNKEKEEASVDDIRERLLQAERRRKQLEDERIVKVRKMIKTESPETVQAYIAERKALEEIQTKKMEDAVASRQMRLRKIRDDMREKDNHARLERICDFMSLGGKDKRSNHPAVVQDCALLT